MVGVKKFGNFFWIPAYAGMPDINPLYTGERRGKPVN